LGLPGPSTQPSIDLGGHRSRDGVAYDGLARLVGQKGRHGNIRIQTGDMQPISTIFDLDPAQVIGCRPLQARQGRADSG